MVHLPYFALSGFCCCIENKFELKEIKEKSSKLINKILTTDCILLYTPSQIAFASLYYTFKPELREDLKKLIEIKTEKPFSDIEFILEQINAFFITIIPSNYPKTIQSIEGKLKSFKSKFLKKKRKNTSFSSSSQKKHKKSASKSLPVLGHNNNNSLESSQSLVGNSQENSQTKIEKDEEESEEFVIRTTLPRN